MDFNMMDPLDGQSLFMLLDRFSLLPRSLFINPGGCEALAAVTNFSILHTDTKIHILLLESLCGEPRVLYITPIVMNKHLIQEEPFVKALAPILWDRWFKGEALDRVEARFPAERKNTCRLLEWWGFLEETYHGPGRSGIRNSVDYGKGSENIVVYGLLPSDEKFWETAENSIAHEKEQVGV